MKQKFKSLSELPLTLTAADIAGFFGISLNNAYSLINSEGFPSIRIGKKKLIVPKDKLLTWIDNQTNTCS